MAARVGLAPTPCGLTNRRATLTPPGNKMALPAGLPPASFRLEDGCLMCSTTAAAFQNWSARQDLHLRSLGPKPSALAATLRAVRPGEFGKRRGLWFCGDGAGNSLELLSVEDWRSRRDLHPHSSRRQRVALLFSYESTMVGSAGNAPVRRFRLYFKTPDLQSGSRNTSLKLVAGAGVAPTEAELMRLA
jgi:hypothetical protein